MNYNIKSVSADLPEITALIKALHKDLELRYGKGTIEDFVEENKSMLIFYAVEDEHNLIVGCGALKHFADNAAEVKRMYVKDEFRGKGISKIILKKLEEKAVQLNYSRIVLETGLKQPEAMKLYEKFGYTAIKSYGRHKDDPDSVCYEKRL
jgi:putative acetyltransferase